MHTLKHMLDIFLTSFEQHFNNMDTFGLKCSVLNMILISVVLSRYESRSFNTCFLRMYCGYIRHSNENSKQFPVICNIRWNFSAAMIEVLILSICNWSCDLNICTHFSSCRAKLTQYSPKTRPPSTTAAIVLVSSKCEAITCASSDLMF